LGTSVVAQPGHWKKCTQASVGMTSADLVRQAGQVIVDSRIMVK
jgi:hypothetical protein